MLKIAREVEYALIALKSLGRARPGELKSVRTICTEYHLPFDATSHVMQKLKHAEIVRSAKGPSGGYQLIRDLEGLSMMELLEAVGISGQLMSCMDDTCGCSLVGTCNIISPLVVLNQRLTEFYQGITVQELFDAQSPQEKLIRMRFAEHAAAVNSQASAL